MEPEPILMDPLPILMDAPLPVEEASTAASSSGEASTEGVGVLGVESVETWQSASSVVPTLAVVLSSGQLGWGCV